MIEFQVPDMRCAQCASRIATAIRRFDAMAKVDADLARKVVRVQSDADPQEIAEALAEAAYPVAGMHPAA